MDHAQTWQQLWQGFGLPQGNPQLLAQLLARWAEPHRKYHGIEHLNACLRHFGRLQGTAERPHEVQMALWFH
ncbi:MAG: N-methyl-D-aspartate receptor NMDAR2C subunit, partial [Burkholderiaceae bacterium]